MSSNDEGDQGTPFRRQRLALIGAGLFVSANICLFGAFEIFSSNQSEFNATFNDVLMLLIGFSLALASLIALPGLLLPRSIRRGYLAALVAFGVLLWFQGGFLRWDYGEFIGINIDWSSFSWQGWVDASIWLAVLAVAIRFRDRLCRHALFLALAFIIIQSGALITRTLSIASSTETSRSGQDAKDEPTSMPSAICRLSSSRNVFHIIMDGFQPDVFMELVGEEDVAESLDGFIFYPENISTGGRTILSVPAIFSTNIYDGTETESEYFSKAMGGSFPHLLYNNGYVVNLMPQVEMTGVPYTNFFPIGATYSQQRSGHLLRVSTYLIDISMFRQFPHFLKRVIYNDQNWRLSSLVSDPPSHVSFLQKKFFRGYIDELNIDDAQPAYHFLHFMPPHPPFVTLADGSYAGRTLPHTRENYKNEARFILRLFMDLIAKLKNLGLYDSSVILMHGDHGAGFSRGNDESAPGIRTSRVSALLLFKPLGSRGQLQSSQMQSSLADIPATLMGHLNIDYPYPGESLLLSDPSSIRDRRVVFVTDRSTHDPTIHKWVVHGSVFDSTSWHPMKSHKLERKIHSYRWGTPVRFGIAHDGDKYLTSGWSTTASNYTWSNGKSAEMMFGIEEPQRDVFIQFTFYPYIVPGKVGRQRIRISVNGTPSGEISCISGDRKAVGKVIPRSLLQDGRMVFSFEFPDAVAPKDIGEGHEPRVFAVKLVHFQADLDTTAKSPGN